ncbi:MAG: hypothetical protein D6820_09090 [Lentisphaerae bacterium]|nr:MAG: hypothetical protein D6820_09090 [Lentisphaerota bacterium]
MYKALDRWLIASLRKRPRPIPENAWIIFCFCDHFEPMHHTSDPQEGCRRVRLWAEQFPILANRVAELFGERLCWNFFYPIEQYCQDHLDLLRPLVEAGLAEIGIHLHHHDDTPEQLFRTLCEGRARLHANGLLPLSPDGKPVYAFVHGNWALNNTHPQRKNCGVDNEIEILLKTGCFADLTMPAAPHPAQVPLVNQLAALPPGPRLAPFHRAIPIQAGHPLPSGHLLYIPGPLTLNWQWRKHHIFPRIENADLTPVNPPALRRLHAWLRASIGIDPIPELFIVKLHTHGAYPDNANMLLHGTMLEFFDQLHQYILNKHPQWTCRFFTARQLANFIINQTNRRTPLFMTENEHPIIFPPNQKQNPAASS